MLRRDAGLFAVAFLVIAGLFAATLCIVTVGFESNDDAAMAQIVSGLTTGQPSPDFVFSNVILGRLLASLYRLTDRVNWYTLYLVATHVLTMTGLLYAFLRFTPRRISLWLFVILFVQFEIGLLLMLQFTSTAVMAGAVGTLLVIAAQLDGDEPSLFAALYGGALIVLAGMVRADSLWYAVLLLCPLMAYEVGLRRAWRTAGALGLCLILSWLVVQYDAWHYRRDPRWRAYLDYNAARAEVHDLPIVDYEHNTRFFFGRLGWSYNDWGMFNSWFFTDPETFSQARVRAIVDRFHGSTWGRRDPNKYLAECLAPVSPMLAMMNANLLLGIVLVRGRRVPFFLIVGSIFILFQGILLVFARYGRLPPRILLPAFFVLSAAAFFLVVRADREREHWITKPANRWVRWAGALAAACFCWYYGQAVIQTVDFHAARSETHIGAQDAFRSMVRRLDEEYVNRDPKTVFLNWGGGFPLQDMPPFDNFRALRRLNLVNLGWYTHSPPFNEAVHRLGLDNVYRATYQNPSVRFFSARIYLNQLEQFVWEHDHEEIAVDRDDAFVLDSYLPTGPRINQFDVYQMQTEPSVDGL